jgi:hypothetical protein
LNQPHLFYLGVFQLKLRGTRSFGRLQLFECHIFCCSQTHGHAFIMLITTQLLDIVSRFGIFGRFLNFKRQSSKLLGLPTELLLLCVDENVPLSSRYMLRQTCRALRSLLSASCKREISLQTPFERLIFLSNVAATRPDHILCGRCHAIHVVNPTDVPTSPWDDYYHCEARHPAHKYGLGYRLRFNHVQLAVKYSRLRLEQSLSKLLAPHSFKHSLFDAATYITEPKVIGGQFFLFSQWSIRPIKASFSRSSGPYVEICPHLCLKYHGTSRLNPLDSQMRALFDRGDDGWCSFSCQRCPTDYELAVSQVHISIKIWQCFGSPQSPLDISWRVLVEKDDTIGQGLTVEHAPGSIRTSFLRSCML